MILICDDDISILSSLSLVLKRAGYETATASGPGEALDFVRYNCPELILMDLNYSNNTSGEEGLELLAKVRIFRPNVPVILITAWGTIDLAVRGIKAGAFDFITKPWNNLALLNSVRTAIEVNRNTSANEPDTRPAGPSPIVRDKIIGRSPQLHKVLDTVARVAPTNASVLITGESGTGKELIAEAIHTNSLRNAGPFVKVNLGGISPTLFESEMFGHKKGAFTDAHYDRKGRFEVADSGTIFLDEIGELDPACQVKLLRVLQDQTFEPLGDSRQVRVDTRVISATNRDLVEMVQHRTFREDLFYRINLITLHIPPLRQRTEDIPLLVEHFVSGYSGSGNSGRPEISADALQFLSSLPYPGNVRELKNLVERTLLVSGKPTLTASDFREQYTRPPETAPLREAATIGQTERAMILRAIELYGSNHSKIAASLGLSRQALYRRMEKYGIKDNDR
ncbi:MAG: sigma-54 dependent transcriptional regulator [Alistipes sp.]|nr:sigma-54 dependent transcriptional regulator [Alistipes sp.]